jgi:hypothetical protein
MENLLRGVPSAFWLAIVLGAPIVLTPILQSFYPPSTNIYSALIIGGLSLLALAARIAWVKKSAKIDAELPSGVAAQAAPVKERSLLSQVIWGA